MFSGWRYTSQNDSYFSGVPYERYIRFEISNVILRFSSKTVKVSLSEYVDTYSRWTGSVSELRIIRKSPSTDGLWWQLCNQLVTDSAGGVVCPSVVCSPAPIVSPCSLLCDSDEYPDTLITGLHTVHNCYSVSVPEYISAIGKSINKRATKYFEWVLFLNCYFLWL